jgi:hypothetical protein
MRAAAAGALGRRHRQPRAAPGMKSSLPAESSAGFSSAFARRMPPAHAVVRPMRQSVSPGRT